MPVILIIIGIILIVFSYVSIKKENSSFEIRAMDELRKSDKSFGRVLEKSTEDLNDYKIELGMFRRNVAESITELQEQIFEIKKHLNMLKDEEILYEDNREDVIKNKENINDGVISEINFNSRRHTASTDRYNKISDSKKTEGIKELLKQGMTVEEVCKQLSVSKGEVLLVQDLFKK
ncbi:DUF6115 domain-containing protein [uncultured Clostridium sp.]|uniref:DUF6115 domain-containing protein n=1 Tax=uncultured Clostridium sp. TaxID=59620 RepID=UPI0025FB841D|nr:hypothetical protein [uncultured Clostridium sp.]